MALKASFIIRKADRVLQDETNIRWTMAEMVDWFNSAQREIVFLKPDALTLNDSKIMAAGTKQKLSSMFDTTPVALRLLDVVRNMGANGVTAGGAVTGVSRHVLDVTLPTWHASPPASEAKHFMFDERDPLTFYVYPPNTGTGYLEVLVSIAPTDITEAGVTADSAVLSLPDVFENVVMDLILYRAYSKDSEVAGNAQRAQAHLQAAMSAIGFKTQSEQYYAPSAQFDTSPSSQAAKAQTGAAR